MSLTIVAQLPTLMDVKFKSRYSRSLMPAVKDETRSTNGLTFLKPKSPGEMGKHISADTKKLVNAAVIDSVKGLENAASSADIPSSISVTAEPISGGNGERLSIMLDMPTPAWDASTFKALHWGTANQDWEPVDFNKFTEAWMSKRDLYIEDYSSILGTAA